MKRFRNWLIGDALAQTDSVFEKARIELTFGYFTFFYLFLFLFHVLLIGSQYTWVFYVSTLGIVLFSATFIVLKKTNNVRLSGLTFFYIYILMNILHGTISNFIMRADNVLWSVSAFIFIFFILGNKMGLIAVAFAAIVTCFGLLNESLDFALFHINIPPEQVLPSSPINVLIPLFIITYVLFKAINTRKKAEQQISNQKIEIESKNKDITDSIRSALRIQNTIIPTEKQVKQHLTDSFILFQPKDILSGDFYSLENIEGKVLFSVADCTGHGVPGALLSITCSAALTKAVKELGIHEPAKILDKVAGLLEAQFSKSDKDLRDGMDIALCCLDLKKEKLEYAGANNPLYYVQHNELRVIKADKQPIGKHENRLPFRNHTIEINKGDCIYIFSDGFADQFGGLRDKKFTYGRFKDLLLSIHAKNMEEQKEILDNTIEKWKGDRDQIDDICVFGIKI